MVSDKKSGGHILLLIFLILIFPFRIAKKLYKFILWVKVKFGFERPIGEEVYMDKNDKKKLNLGCGDDIREDFINVDKKPASGVDLILDLNDKLPFKDNSMDYIILDNVLEHLDDPLSVMKEVGRISRPDSRVKVVVPHFRNKNAYALNHKCFFSETSLNPILKGSTWGGLESESLFKLINIDYRYRYPFCWHQQKYLGGVLVGFKRRQIIFKLKTLCDKYDL